MDIGAVLLGEIKKTIKTVDEVIKREHPIILAEMAKELFTNEGHFNNRPGWEANAASTIRKKKNARPNVETGFLEEKLSTPGVLEDDNWLDNLTPPPGVNGRRRNTNGYKYANVLRKFDDIGKTPEDKALIEKELEKELKNALTST